MIPEPKHLRIARKYIGMKEIPGKTHNNKLINLLNTALRYNGVKWVDDEMAWCGGFVAAVLLEAGIEPVKIAARAKSWANFSTNLDPTKLTPGAILVFGRDGGGHVGFYLGEDDTRYYVLGGNQSNMVRVSPILKSRLIASRWPRGVAYGRGPVRMSSTEAASQNEA